jgi:PAS domain S-box-containing protein
MTSRVIVVAGDAAFADDMRQLLAGAGESVDIRLAQTGAQAVEAILNRQPRAEALLAASRLPDLRAAGLLAAIRQPDGPPACAAVIISPDDSTDEATEVLQAGAQAYLAREGLNARQLRRALGNAAISWQLARSPQDRTASGPATDYEAFQLAFTDAIRPLSDPHEIKATAARLLGEHLGASRVMYCEKLDGDRVLVERGYVDGVAQIDGTYQLHDFGQKLLPELAAGRDIVSSDVRRDPDYTDVEKDNYAKAELVANLSVPLLKEGDLVAILGVHQNAPRVWTERDRELVREVAERTWSAVDHAHAVSRMRASQMRLAQMIEIMPSFSAVLRGPQHVFELANQPYYDMIGRGPEILGKPVVEALPEIADQPFPALLDKVFWSGEPFHATGMVAKLPRGPGGSLVDIVVDFSYLPLREPAGQVSGILVHGLDRTEEFEKAEKIRRQERELRSMADNTPDVLTRFDRQLRHVFVNSAIERITGRKVEELIGKTNRELGMPLHLCDQWDAAINHVFERGSHSSLDFEWETPNDGVRHYSCRLVPEFNEQGGVESVLGVTHDITHRKAFERELSEQARRKDEFLATLAHELRNPLAPIRTGLQVLKLAPDSAAAARTLPMMERQLGQMVRLIDDLLDVSRITSGKIVLRRERITLQTVAASAVEASRPLIDAAGHSLMVDLPAEPVWLDADPTRMAQVISNLLSNSAKYTRAGGQIWLAARLAGGQVRITVTDNGMGIPEDMLSGVFDMFTQINRTLDRSEGGLGLGLSLVRTLVDLHGGSVRADSRGIDQGSEFTVTLPVATPPATQPEDGAEPVPKPVPAGGRRILVVDDNVDAAETMAMLLDLSGYDARAAFSGPEALVLAQSFRPELVFLDIGLPGMNGYEVAAKLRADPATRAVRLIALTGWGTGDDQRKSAMAGFDAHVTKPVEAGQIESVLETFLPARSPA